jgi:hypothetical protein
MLSNFSYLSVEFVIKVLASVSKDEAINWNESINLTSPTLKVMNFSIELGTAPIVLSVPHSSKAYFKIICES